MPHYTNYNFPRPAVARETFYLLTRQNVGIDRILYEKIMGNVIVLKK